MKTTQILKKCSFILIAMFMAWAWANIASAADLWQENPSLKQESKRTLGWENSSVGIEAINYMPADDYYTEQINQSQITTNTGYTNVSSVNSLPPAIPGEPAAPDIAMPPPPPNPGSPVTGGSPPDSGDVP